MGPAPSFSVLRLKRDLRIQVLTSDEAVVDTSSGA